MTGGTRIDEVTAALKRPAAARDGKNYPSTSAPTLGVSPEVVSRCRLYGADKEEAEMRVRRGKRWAGRAATIVAGTLALAVFAASPASAAQAGDLDTSFSGDGAAVADVYTGAADYGEAMAIQPDGKIVVAGTWGFSGGYNNWAVMRFMPDGTVDKSFASGGRTLTDFDNDYEWATGVAIAPDGKIVVVGHALVDGPARTKQIAVARYETDGDRDPTFSGDGKVWHDIGGDFAEANDVAIQRDGKIVIAGMRYSNSAQEDYAVVRLTTTGGMDTTFSSDGKAFATFGEGQEGAQGVAIQPADNKIVVGGWAMDDGDTDFALARFDRFGNLDPSFDGNGTLLTGFGLNDGASDVAITIGGKIVAAGNHGYDFAVAQYTSSGAPDTTFDTDGKRSIPFGRFGANGVAVQRDGRIVLVGESRVNRAPYLADFALARFMPSGQMDRSFSGDGMLTQGVSAGDSGRAVAIQPDGKIVAAGWSHGGTSTDDAEFCVLRFHHQRTA
jgi:uncharacterized delta-60 repeat protein